MFSYLKLKNYKSLVDIEANFLNKRKNPKQLILLYGENGAGKSNFTSAFYTLAETLKTMEFKNKIDLFREEFIKENFNDDLDINPEIVLEKLNKVLKNKFRSLDTLISQSKTIGSKDNMILEFGINLNGKNGYYLIETNNEEVVREELYFTIEKNKGYYFELTKNEKKLNSRLFLDQAYCIELKELLDKFWGKHTFLSILCNELDEKVTEYIKDKISHNFLEVIEFLSSFSCKINEGNYCERGQFSISNKMFTQLKNGTIPINEEIQLNQIELFLKIFFTSLYSDIKDVYYLKNKSSNSISYKLYCKKLIGNTLVDIDFHLESTGTLQLLKLIPSIIMAIKGKTVIIDEFDSGIHDLMVKHILFSINEYITGQLIITTHNTSLMEKSVPLDSLYFIVIDSNGDKEILCLTDYEKRTYPNNNIRDLYLKGMYEGIPYFVDLNFNELIQLFDN